MNTFLASHPFPMHFPISPGTTSQVFYPLPFINNFPIQSLHFSQQEALQMTARFQNDAVLQAVKKIKTEAGELPAKLDTAESTFVPNENIRNPQICIKTEDGEENEVVVKAQATQRANLSEASTSDSNTSEIPHPEVGKNEGNAKPIDVNDKKSPFQTLIQETRKNMYQCWQKQLELLKVLEELNQPQNAEEWPMLEHLNPIVIGMMNKKFTMEQNTITVLERSLQLVKSEPAKKKNKNSDKKGQAKSRKGSFASGPTSLNGKRTYEDLQSSSSSDPALRQVKEIKAAFNLEQIMNFIVTENSQ